MAVVYESLIEDMDHVQGDSSATWYVGLPDGRQLNDGFWSGRYVIATKNGVTPLIDKPLLLNSGLGENGDIYEQGTKFVFQILPLDAELLTGGREYIVAVEISNLNINYRREFARFTLNVLKGN